MVYDQEYMCLARNPKEFAAVITGVECHLEVINGVSAGEGLGYVSVPD